MPELVWRKSSRSGGGANECVEVAIGSSDVLIRDSKEPDGARLRIDATTWFEFVAAVKAGQFDRPASEPEAGPGSPGR